ncbi:MAG: deoxyribodipyrimidine photo-lyase [Campylobacterota bacterium]|nr:deoxyribodipyrimidine photo-lyase [Campylobacterota bacterium]
MKEILWFRRDLRVEDSALLAYAKGEVLPIFIFDTHILKKLSSDDRRVSFIYYWIEELKRQLQEMGLDLAIFYGEPTQIFRELKKQKFSRVLCSVDYDSYAIERDKKIDKIIPMMRLSDSWLIEPDSVLKKDGTPYEVFTPFYKSLKPLWSADKLEEYQPSSYLRKAKFDYDREISIESMGFKWMRLEEYLYQSPDELIEEFKSKLKNYKEDRDYFYLDASSNLSTHLRFGVISPRQIFNAMQGLEGSQAYIRQLFWREFYNYILYHFPKSENSNFNGIEIEWEDNTKQFKAWCEGRTGVPIIDAAMRHLNQTGLMHNRLRMIVASFLTKNLLIDWRRGEKYFASKLMDYEASSNIGSWQWAASTGADSVSYFRVFNPYAQSSKFDKEAIFIKELLPELSEVPTKLIHKEYGLKDWIMFIDGYLSTPIVNAKFSRQRAIEQFKGSKNIS